MVFWSLVLEFFMAKPFLTAAWRDLVLLNWRVEESLLSSYLPAGVELDRWEGDCWASLVGFRFLDMSVKGLPALGYRNFPEINLRFYVKREIQGELRRGVVFVKELTQHRLVGWVARTIYNEPYETLHMRQTVNESRALYEVQIDSDWQGIGLKANGPWREQNEMELFITEHYWGYNTQKNKDSMEYRVEHPVWRTRSVDLDRYDLNVRELYGNKWEEALASQPDTMVFSEGSKVTVYSGERI
mgnify:CR=1 FL=1